MCGKALLPGSYVFDFMTSSSVPEENFRCIIISMSTSGSHPQSWIHIALEVVPLRVTFVLGPLALICSPLVSFYRCRWRHMRVSR